MTAAGSIQTPITASLARYADKSKACQGLITTPKTASQAGRPGFAGCLITCCKTACCLVSFD